MSASTPDSRTCPKCSAVLPAEAAEGLCPRCLMAEAMQPSGPKKTWEPPTAAELGELLPDYDIEKLLGRGGMGAVYKGTQKSLDRPVAIKILSATLDESDQGFAERFKNEARALGKLKHPGIVGVYDFGTAADGLLYIVMEYIDGTDVAKMIAQKGRLHTEHAMAITAHVCDALAYAHERGIIHRDIKPANIMVGYDGVVQVTDFGLAKVSIDGQTLGLTQSGMAMGTMHYMAPESLTLGTSVDHRADIYAVGVMLYQMLTGKLPQGLFSMPSLQIKGLDPRYDGIIGRALMEDRDARYQTITEMRMGLDEILTQPVVKAEAGAGKTPAALNTQARPKRAEAKNEPLVVPHHDEQAGKRSFNWQWAVLVVLLALGAWEYLRKHPAVTLQSDDLVNAGTTAVTPPAVAAVPAVASDQVASADPAPSPALPSASPANPAAVGRPAPAAASKPQVAVSSDPAKATKDQPFVNSHGMKFVPVPGTNVLFCIHETRMQDYAAFARAEKVDGSWQAGKMDDVLVAVGPDYPVCNVNWDDANRYCFWLTQSEIKKGSLPQGLKYRLPRDEEWSRAAGLESEVGMTITMKSGRETVTFPWGTSFPPGPGAGNYAEMAFHKAFPTAKEGWLAGYDDTFPTTAPVMSFRPNALGIYDLGGNVNEWCEEAMSNRTHLNRGGSWQTSRREAMLASDRAAGWSRQPGHGFRCVIELSTAGTTATTPASTAIPTTTVEPEAPPSLGTLPPATKDAPFVNSLGMKFVPVPDADVLFCIHETRRQDYAAFAAANPDTNNEWMNQRTLHQTAAGGESVHPVVGVSWHEAAAFCAWLSKQEGHLYRLPTDREWSQAVGIADRESDAPNSTPELLSEKLAGFYPWGSQWPPPVRAGNYADLAWRKSFSADLPLDGYADGFPTTAPVMSFQPNGLGLYDLGGNVWEWCQDWWNDAQEDRVLRGGCWNDLTVHPNLWLSSFRFHRTPGMRDSSVGFRCVIEIDSTTAMNDADNKSSATLLEQQYQAAIAKQVTPAVEAYAKTLLTSYRSALERAAKAPGTSKSDVAALDQEIQRFDTQDLVPDDEGANATITKLRTIYLEAVEKFRDEKTAPLKAVYDKQQAAAQKPSSVSSSFTADAEGWTVYDSSGTTLPVRHDSKGFIARIDPGQGADFYFVAPPAYIETAHRASPAAALAFDLHVNASDDATYEAVVLESPTLTLVLPKPNPPINRWKSYRFLFHPSEGWKVGTLRSNGSRNATAAEIEKVLHTANRLLIRGEWSSAPDAAWLDNVRLDP